MTDPERMLDDLEIVVDEVKKRAGTCILEGLGDYVSKFNGLSTRIIERTSTRHGSSLNRENIKRLRKITNDYELAIKEIESGCDCSSKSWILK